MAAGDVRQSPDHGVVVHRARRVVRVDDDDRLGAVGDLAFDVREVRHPVGLLVAAVVDRRTAGEGDRGRPQGVVGGGDEHLVAVVEQGLHRHHDQLGDAVADEDVLDVRLDAEGLVVHDDRPASRQEPLRVAVAVGRRHVPEDVLEDLGRSLEAEGGRVAGVQLEDAVPCRLQPHRLFENRAPDLVTDVGELGRLDQLHVRELTAG